MKKKILPVIVIIGLIILIGGIYGAQIALEHFAYSKERMNLNDYFELTSDDQVAIVLGNERLTEKYAKLKDGNYYMTIEDVNSCISNRFYYGEADGILVYVAPTQIITARVGENVTTSSKGETEDLGFPISFIEGDSLYVSLDYVQKYSDLFYTAYSEPNRIQMYVGLAEYQTAEIKKNTAIRYRGGVKSEILRDLNQDEIVVVLDELDDWVQVRSEDGFIGYIEKKFLGKQEQERIGKELPEDLAEYTNISLGSKVNMAFHSIGGTGGNDTISSALSSTKTVNVIAPTWFSLTGNDGSITSYASNDYVTYAHSQNIQVWAVVDNFNGNGDADTEAVVSSAAARANLISQLISKAKEYNIDGINVDFEQIGESYARSYVEFLRELSVACRENQIIFSIDNYVPMNFNDYYDLTEQGIVADYVIIMGYDEHYAGSAEAGSVASIDYVVNGINSALEEVSADKLINAVPFYSRVWTTKGTEVSSRALHMSGMQSIIAENNVEMSWDDTTCQYYGEFTDGDGNLNQIWNEDARSIEAKLSVMQSSGIAGVAEWALGFETEDVWDVIASYMAQ
ncbi:MAG: chitinase [Butyrivibrio sp.]|nr:chitinase [Butyrivibrio sp.]